MVCIQPFAKLSVEIQKLIPYNIFQIEERLQEDLQFLSEVKSSVRDASEERTYKLLFSLITRMTCRVKDIRLYQVKLKKKLETFKAAVARGLEKFQPAVTKCTTDLTTSYNCIQKCLSINYKICKLMAELQGNSHIFGHNIIPLAQKSNVRRLHPPSVTKQELDLAEFPHLVKQRSEEWFSLRKESYVTGAFIYIIILY